MSHAIVANPLWRRSPRALASLVLLPLVAALLACSVPEAGAPAALAARSGASNCAQPPAHVDLTTLSAAQLARYGVGGRPSDPIERQRWTALLRQYHHRVCTATPLRGVQFTRVYNNHWAGVVSVGGGYDEVYANWEVPSVRMLYISHNTNGFDAASWVGIGDGTNSTLVQAGTEQSWTYDFNLNNWKSQYFAWIEVVTPGCSPTKCPAQQVFSVSPGDSMSVVVESPVQGQNFFDVIDNTSHSCYCQTQSGATANGSTAEWIIERSQPYLAQFDTSAFCTTCLLFSGAGVIQNGTNKYVGKTTNNNYYMTSNGQSSGTVLAQSGGPNVSDGGKSLWVNWQCYGVPSGNGHC